MARTGWIIQEFRNLERMGLVQPDRYYMQLYRSRYFGVGTLQGRPVSIRIFIGGGGHLAEIEVNLLRLGSVFSPGDCPYLAKSATADYRAIREARKDSITGSRVSVCANLLVDKLLNLA